MKSLLAFLLGFLLIAPSAAFAAEGLELVLQRIGGVINVATPLVVAIALLAFFWGLAMYIFGMQGGEDKDKKKGRDLMLYGIIILFVIMSVWGLVQILRNTIGLEGTSDAVPDVPYIIPR